MHPLLLSEARGRRRRVTPSVKALALRARRLSSAAVDAVVRAMESNSDHQTVFATEDGALAFTLTRQPTGLYVERVQRRPLGLHLVQSLFIDSLHGFERWIEVDSVRFEQPILYDNLRRFGNGYFWVDR